MQAFPSGKQRSFTRSTTTGAIPGRLEKAAAHEATANAHQNRCEASRAARGAGGIPVDRATWRQIRESAAVVGFDEAELDAWTQRCTASV